jgi:hypothetical protein
MIQSNNLVYLQSQLYKFLELVMVCSTNSK